MILFDDKLQIVFYCFLSVLDLDVVGLLQALGMLASRVVQLGIQLIIHDRVPVRHLITAEVARQSQRQVVIHRDIDVELGLQRKYLLLFRCHAAPNYVYNRVVELEIHGQLVLAEFWRNEDLLILLDL